jgi:hypothetical protein
MKKSAAFVLFSASSLLICAGAVSAGTISIGISHRLEIGADGAHAIVTVSNSGDEAAHSVGVQVEVLGVEHRGETHTTLRPGTSYEETLPVAMEDLPDGRWPYRIAVDYTDANQYPFQALSLATFLRGNPPPSQIAVSTLEAPGLAQHGPVIVSVKNLSDAERSAELRLVLPRGIDVPGGNLEFTLTPWEERSLEVPVVNRFALAGSRYPVYAVVEYDEDSTHQAIVASGDLEIIEAVTVVESSRSYLWILAVALGVLFAALLLWKLGAR